jgi:hypothetical protein
LRTACQVARDVVRTARLGDAPLGFVAVVEEDGATARAAPGLDVVEDVADHPRRRELHAVLACRALQHPGRRLAAFAAGLGQVRAIVKAVEGGKEVAQLRFDLFQL